MSQTLFEVFFDTETKKFFDDIEGYDPAKLGVSITSVYSRTLDDNLNEVDGKMQSFWEKDFPEMFKLFEKADRIVGFNSISFDIPALSPYLPVHWPKLKHFDILSEIKKVEGKRMSLDSIAKATLGAKKNDSGVNAIKYWAAGDPESLAKLKKYCEMDVEITKNIYDHALKNGVLKYIDFWNETHEIKLDFSYPIPEQTIQNSLF
ncbi:MAG TPA: ribonuclease H-like domain-containing protein [Candidatus Saccharimonadales bacterium]|jgi:DEAD/DEAH box helicase domain-containing protein|nr:ribonuclease H-like domain-containing protein [Candidatus Saccharimonadales bacterium]